MQSHESVDFKHLLEYKKLRVEQLKNADFMDTILWCPVFQSNVQQHTTMKVRPAGSVQAGAFALDSGQEKGCLLCK